MDYLWLFGLLALIPAFLAYLGFQGREQIVGIDLGTTFSVVAVKKHYRDYAGRTLASRSIVEIIPDYETGKPLLPSVVHFGSTCRVCQPRVSVGKRAVQLRDDHPVQTIFNGKRYIGKTIGETSGDARNHPFNVTANISVAADEAVSSRAGFSIPSDSGPIERWVSPVDVGAEIVKRLKDSVTAYMGYEMKKAVICVPARFSSNETQATQQAFEKAGFKVMRVLTEPTAAAIAYNLHMSTDGRNVLVYDIGGGTLDVSLLYMSTKSVSVMGVAGDSQLGGSDFDEAMRHILTAKVAAATGQPAGGDKASKLHRCDSNGLGILAEVAKIALSQEQTVEVQCLDADKQVRTLVSTREEFEESSRSIFERCIAPVEKVLEDQMMSTEDVDDIVLVGGASRTPKLRALLQEFMGPDKKLHIDIDPDVTIAYGAANIID